MQFEITAGFIKFSLDMWEFKMNGPAFIEALKNRIPREDREYDPDNYVWTVKEEHLETIRGLRKEFLQDKNQIDMF